MKRYYCGTCQRVVRCRRLPDGAVENLNERAAPGHALLATCRHHEEGAPRSQVNDRRHVHASFGSTRKLSASSARSKSKKG